MVQPQLDSGPAPQLRGPFFLLVGSIFRLSAVVARNSRLIHYSEYGSQPHNLIPPSSTKRRGSVFQNSQWEFLGFTLIRVAHANHVSYLALELRSISSQTTGLGIGRLVVPHRKRKKGERMQNKSHKLSAGHFALKKRHSEEGTCVEIRIIVYFVSCSQPLTWQDHPQQGR